MALEKFIPTSPDLNLTTDSDLATARFGHLNTLVDAIKNLNFNTPFAVISSTTELPTLQVDNNGSVYNLGPAQVSSNTVFGFNALSALTASVENVAIGYNAAQLGSYQGVAIGYNAAGNAIQGGRSVAVGRNAGLNSAAGSYVAVGYNALLGNISGGSNTAIVEKLYNMLKVQVTLLLDILLWRDPTLVQVIIMLQ
jgi:hypothetical protein